MHRTLIEAKSDRPGILGPHACESTFQLAERLRRLQNVINCRISSWRVSNSVGFNKLSLPVDHRKLLSGILTKTLLQKNEISVKVFDILYFILYFNFYFQIFLSTLFSVLYKHEYFDCSATRLPSHPFPCK